MSIVDIRNAIIEMEGKPGDLNYRNNNPGNLRYNSSHPEYTPGAIGMGEGGFAKYATWQDGVNDLDRQIQIDAGRGLSVSQFISKYAPSFENDTANYLSWLKSQLHVSSGDVKLTSIISEMGTDESSVPSDIYGDAASFDTGSISMEMMIGLVIGGVVGGYYLLK